MIPISVVIEELRPYVVGAALWYFVLWLLADYHVDHFRQKLFALRDELFDRATAGEIEFDSAAYTLMRNTLNGYIRFAHKMSLSHFAVFLLMPKKGTLPKRDSFQKRWDAAMSALPIEGRSLVEKTRSKMEVAAAKRTILGSPIMLITVVPWIVFLIVLDQWASAVVSVLKRPLSRLDDEALACGRLSA